jgi:hypothetical protein
MIMDTEKLSQWLLVVSHIGILAGLVMVGIQINQDSELTRLQMFSDVTSSRIQLHEALLGDNPAPVVMKSLTHPEELTLEELRIMDAYLLMSVNEARRKTVLSREGLRVDAVEEENLLIFYFGNRFAQEWWKEFTSEGENMENEINVELDRIIRSAANTDMTRSFFRNLGERISIKSTEDI